MTYQDELDAKAAAVLEQMRKESGWRPTVRFLIGLAVAMVVYALALLAAGQIFHFLSRWL